MDMSRLIVFNGRYSISLASPVPVFSPLKNLTTPSPTGTGLLYFVNKF